MCSERNIVFFLIVIWFIALLVISGIGIKKAIDNYKENRVEYSYVCVLDMKDSGDETIRDVEQWYMLDDFVKFRLTTGEIGYVGKDTFTSMTCEKIEKGEN